MDKIIIASIIPVGKEEWESALGTDKVIVLDHFDYEKMKLDNGSKFSTLINNPEWPDNYIKVIRTLAYESEGTKDYDSIEYIIINPDPDTLEFIVKSKIPVVIAMPRDFIVAGFDKSRLSQLHKINRKLLELDMPMLYVTNKESLLNILKLSSTYTYFVNKTEYVEAYRFGSFVYDDDLIEFADIYEENKE